jgi:ribosome-binding ATPase YchF (GTP1/OBG family)
VKICVYGIPGIALGKHNLKDPRLDQADKLVEAKKKTYAQVDVVGEEATLEADAIVVHPERFPDLILHDLEFVETRLGRNPPDAEKAVLLKIQAELEAERTMYKAGLSQEEWQAVAAHSFHTHKPVIVANEAELAAPDAFMLRAFKEGGFISYLTVGGKENRAWPIPSGATAWEAAGAIHTDIQKGFIRAEIISFADFAEAGGETQAKRAGKLRLELKTYVMQDYDVTSFRFNK